jgi:hypothetical protein
MLIYLQVTQPITLNRACSSTKKKSKIDKSYFQSSFALSKEALIKALK